MAAFYKGLILHHEGTEYRIMDYGNVLREREANGKIDLSFSVVETERNKDYFNLIQRDSVIELVDKPGEKGQKYRVLKSKRKRKGQATVRDCTLRHAFFDIVDDHQPEELSGTINATQALNHIFDPTPYSWVNQGSFNSVVFENWGNANCLKLFQEFLTRYGGEFVVDSVTKTVTLKVEQGKIYEEGIFRYNHNIKTITEEIDVSNVATYIEGKGKRTEDEEGNLISQVTASYTSPYWTNYKDSEGVARKRHAGVIEDERFTSVESLEEHLEKILNDEPEIFIEIDALELRKNIFENGKYNTDKVYNFELYDTVPFIYEPWEYNTEVRILSVKDAPLNPSITPVYSLSGIKETITDKTARLESSRDVLKDLTDQDGNLSLQIKRLYRNSTMYDDHTGSWWIAEDDPNAFVHVGAGGLVVKKGLAYIEDETGFAWIIGGKLTHNFDLQHQVPIKMSPSITLSPSSFWTSQSTDYGTCTRFTFNHLGRYLILELAQFVESGGMCYVQAYDTGDGSVLGSSVSTNTDSNFDSGNSTYIIIDLGVKTGLRRSVNLNLRSNSNNIKVYASMVRGWISDYDNTNGNV